MPSVVAEKLDRLRRSGRAGLQARVQAFYFCHPERTSVREGSAFSTFSAASSSLAVPDRIERARLQPCRPAKVRGLRNYFDGRSIPVRTTRPAHTLVSALQCQAYSSAAWLASPVWTSRDPCPAS